MNEDKYMRIIKRILATIGILLAIAIVTLALLLTVSPKPTASFFARAFNGPVKITNKKMYDENQSQLKGINPVLYGHFADENADIYQPKAQMNNKVVVWVHGGGYIGGDKVGLKEFATDLVAKTHVTFMAINYSLAPDAKYPTQLKQLSKALGYMREHAADFGLDPNKVEFILGGDSAGAQIAAQYAALATNTKYAQTLKEVTVAPNINIAGTVLYCGPYDFKQILADSGKQSLLMKWFTHTIGWSLTGSFFWKNSNLVEQGSVPDKVTAEYPTSYITDGNKFTFESSGKKLVQSLQANKVPVTSRFFAKKEAVNHEYQFALNTKRAQETFTQTVTFVNNLK